MKTITKLSISLLFLAFSIQLNHAAVPTTPAPTPTRASSNVKSIYSDAYTNITAITKHWFGDRQLSPNLLLHLQMTT